MRRCIDFMDRAQVHSRKNKLRTILIGWVRGPSIDQLVSYTGVNSTVRVEIELATRLALDWTAATLTGMRLGN